MSTRGAFTVAAVYALLYGAIETLSLPVPVPGSHWQVPSHWVRGRAPRRAIAIWGAILGPGLWTRNPYAGIWMVALVLAASAGPAAGALAGAAAGGAHGAVRAAGVVAELNRGDAGGVPERLIARQYRWRYVDGALLLFAGGWFVTLLG
ncbi:MAG: hypothetical protein M3323_10160 [Actinomycetota bacterium]|nr:hypothetical protein [Actinomycetota bacterium]